MSANYQEVVNSVKSAIKSSKDSEGKWKTAGSKVVELFPNPQALQEVKAQFIADAILPVMDKEHIEALNKQVPRQGSKEFKDLLSKDADYQAKFDAIQKAKKTARSISNTYFTRVLEYAFPEIKEDKEEDKPVVSDTTKDIEVLNGFIKRLEKAESRPYDLAQVINNLKVTLTLIHE